MAPLARLAAVVHRAAAYARATQIREGFYERFVSMYD